ncbi:MAG: hypothetical protein GY796_25270 [Chloroflexi bacterium]|nr:hypothetical protein [Chloroflexota bacterium]
MVQSFTPSPTHSKQNGRPQSPSVPGSNLVKIDGRFTHAQQETAVPNPPSTQHKAGGVDGRSHTRLVQSPRLD